MTSEITISPAFEALGLSEPDGYTSDPLSDLTELEDDDSEDNDNSKSTAPAGDRKDGGTPDNKKSERKAKVCCSCPLSVAWPYNGTSTAQSRRPRPE